MRPRDFQHTGRQGGRIFVYDARFVVFAIRMLRKSLHSVIYKSKCSFRVVLEDWDASDELLLSRRT